MARFLYLDIETIPTQDPAQIERIAAGIRPPGNISKAETIAKWEAETKPDAVREAVARTSFDGAFGHVVAIGFAVDAGPGDVMVAQNLGDEAALIFEAFARMQGLFGDRFARPTIVGHNVGFDIRFLWQRAFVLGVRLPPWFPRDPKPWGEEIADTMVMWAGARDTASMDKVCHALGIAGKAEGMTGADVAPRWAARNFEAIAEYCVADVERTRSMHRRMLASFGEALPEPYVSREAAA